ncbi:MAG: hypothetical protein J6V14_07770, partial [Clostridia bacterium]|nr:hypothetical protein [Clostridia bacterium]
MTGTDTVNTDRECSIAPRGLRLDLRRGCVCVLPEALAFSWQPGPGWNGAEQAAYRLVVTTGDAGEIGSPVYDSGFVASPELTGVVPPGIAGALRGGERLYRWAVQVQLTDGRVSEFQNGQFFTVARGPLPVSDGIWAPGGPYFALFQRDFSILAGTTRVLLRATALSPEPARQFVFNLYVNDAEIGVGPSRLDKLSAPDDTNNVLYYSTYDITDLIDLAPGAQNRLTALCHAAEGKAFYAELLCFDRLGFKHGDRPGVQKWQARNGDAVYRPDNSIGTHYYRAYAANVDAVAVAAGENEDGGWTAAEVVDGAFSGYVLLPAKTETAKRHACELPPEAVRKIDGGWFVDLGREIVGGLGAVIAAPQETEIEVRCGEELNPDGSVRFAMRTGNVYTARWHVGPGVSEVNTPDLMTFCYAEFRAAAPFTLERVHSLALRTDPDDTESGFSSDSVLLERLYAFTKYTIKMTTQDLYVDSQSRERGAYEGDALINMLASYTFYSDTAVPRATLEYLYTHRTWPAEYLLLMPTLARADLFQTGDSRSARKYWPRLKACTFEHFRGPEGLLHSGNTAAQGMDAILTDWPPSERDNYDTGVSYSTVLNCMAVRGYRDLAVLAAELGEASDAARYEAMATELATAIIDRLWDPDNAAFCDGLAAGGTRSTHCSQHASAYALYGLGRRYLTGAQTDALTARIRADGRIKMSVYGAYFLLTGLYECGAGDIANALLLRDGPGDPRTWAYMLDTLGATLTAEAWCPANKPNMTFSHPWGAAPAVLIPRGIFGLEPLEPGWKRFRVDFRRAGLERASIVLPTPYGSITASFSGDAYHVTVP